MRSKRRRPRAKQQKMGTESWGARNEDEKWFEHAPVTGRESFILTVLDGPDVQRVGSEEQQADGHATSKAALDASARDVQREPFCE